MKLIYRQCSFIAVLMVLGACSSGTRQPEMRGSAPNTSLPSTRATEDVLPSPQAQDLVLAASQFIGKPYRWGSSDPQEGFDCSGLVVYVVQQTANIKLPRTSREIATRGLAVSRSALAPGDFVFFNTSGQSDSHVGIYAGQGRFIHAPSSKGVIRLESMQNPYWQNRYTQARRLFVM